MRIHESVPNFGIQVRFDDAPDACGAHAPSVAELLRRFDLACLRTTGPDRWGATARLVEVVGSKLAVARLAAEAGGPLDARERRRLARESWFVFGPRAARSLHVRVLSERSAALIDAIAEALARSELPWSGPTWRYEATRRESGFRTVFMLHAQPGREWLLSVVAGAARRLELACETSMRRDRLEARAGELDLAIELPRPRGGAP